MASSHPDDLRVEWMNHMQAYLAQAIAKPVTFEHVLGQMQVPLDLFKGHEDKQTLEFLLHLVSSPIPIEPKDFDYQIQCALLFGALHGKGSYHWSQDVVWKSTIQFLHQLNSAGGSSKIGNFRKQMQWSSLIPTECIRDVSESIDVGRFTVGKTIPRPMTATWVHYLYICSGWMALAMAAKDIQASEKELTQVEKQEAETIIVNSKVSAKASANVITGSDVNPVSSDKGLGKVVKVDTVLGSRTLPVSSDLPAPELEVLQDIARSSPLPPTEPKKLPKSPRRKKSGVAGADHTLPLPPPAHVSRLEKPPLSELKYSLFKSPLNNIRIVTWNTNGFRIADDPEAVKHLVVYFKCFDIVLLQELGATNGPAKLKEFMKNFENWGCASTGTGGKSQNAVMWSDAWDIVPKNEKPMCSVLRHPTVAGRFIHPAICVLLSNRYTNRKVVAASVHISPTSVVTEDGTMVSGGNTNVDGIRSEVNDTVDAFVELLKQDWVVPYSFYAGRDMRIQVPLLVLGGDFNLYPNPTHNEPGVRSLLPGRGDGDTTGRLRSRTRKLTTNLDLFTGTTNPFTPTTKAKNGDNVGNAYDGFLINKDYLTQESTSSTFDSNVRFLAGSNFSDHEFVELSVQDLI